MLQAIEKAYWRVSSDGLGKIKGGQLIGRICWHMCMCMHMHKYMCMSRMGGLRLMCIPSHVGSYPSAYANAAAKAYLQAAHVEDVTA
eukprot:438964-Prymnesium_polylepis.1